MATGDAPLRFLAFSTSGDLDIAIYPDSGKVSAAERRPRGFREIFRRDDKVDYWVGESPPHG